MIVGACSQERYSIGLHSASGLQSRLGPKDGQSAQLRGPYFRGTEPVLSVFIESFSSL